MTEKVLGFKEKDALQDNHDLFFDEASLVIPKSKLVPVVSLEWLEKTMEELEKQFDNDKYNQYNSERGFYYLLLEAKKEAEQK